MLLKPPLNKTVNKNPKPIGTMTPAKVINMLLIPVVFICLKSVPRPALNIIKITPNLAINPNPSLEVSVKIN